MAEQNRRRPAMLLVSLFLIAMATIASVSAFCYREYLRPRQPVFSVPRLVIHNKRPSSLLHSSNKNNEVSSDEIIAALEKQVVASAQSRIDMDRVLKVLEEDNPTPIKNDLMYDDEDLARTTALPHWQVAVAAASSIGGLSFVTFQSYYVSVFVSGFVFVAALVNDDSLSGALARVVGRSTIRSVQASQPKIKALARAAVNGEEEIISLKQRIQELEDETASLRLWKERRLKVDEALSRFTLNELKETARQNKIAVGGSKSELLLRLVEADAVRL